MRRIVQLLFLLAFALTRAAAAQCPMAPPAADGAERAMHHGAAHDAMHGPAHRPASHHSDEPAHRADCGVVMQCGLAAVSSGTTVDAPVPIDPAAAPAQASDLYASPCIATLSPPPRGAIPA
ncbi:hypothetical protein [Longimicrobium sp.]|uniref:hypothetical protein n=1 Tax=Longimicrobium sp. TaxID=2029185 RepID=UPI002B918D39|nr:hypothetical protein [Longimicrobium sp.]HSU17786.1 hypothetical protein [Longimicrobium sp.]